MSLRDLPRGMLSAIMAGYHMCRRNEWMIRARERVSPVLVAQCVSFARAYNHDLVRCLRDARKAMQP